MGLSVQCCQSLNQGMPWASGSQAATMLRPLRKHHETFFHCHLVILFGPELELSATVPWCGKMALKIRPDVAGSPSTQH